MEVRDIAGVPTHVYSLQSSSDESKKHETPLVLVIPGSPGMGHFYIPFVSKLFKIGQGRFDVTVVSHAGHSPGHYKDTANQELASEEAHLDEISVRDKTDWYTLQDQVAHKLAFIRKEARDRELILIGHSIGSWMILQMLQRLKSIQVSKVFLLFPTIEKMAISPNGQSLLSCLWHSLRRPFTGLVWLSSRMPESLKKFVVNRHFHSTPREHLEDITQGAINIDEKSLYNILLMARQEMEEVVEPPLDVIDENIDKILFYYGVGDRWNVESCYSDMASRYPEKEVYLCSQNIAHAFVECSSDEMATFVSSKL